MVMNKHSYLSTRLSKQYKNRCHITYKAKCVAFNKTANVTAAGNMNAHGLFYLICVHLLFPFLT